MTDRFFKPDELMDLRIAAARMICVWELRKLDGHKDADKYIERYQKLHEKVAEMGM